MLLVKLQGGLGNQMFQYASAKGISKINEPIYLDHQFLETHNTDKEYFTARKYELGIFENIKTQKASTYQLKLFKSQSLYFRFLRSVFKVCFIKQKENEFIFPQEISKSTYRYMDGYFQSEKYFKHIRKQLTEELEFPPLDACNEQLKNKIINTPNAVSIHIRRGDYLKSPVTYDIHGVMPPGYYEKALNILKSKYNNLTLFVFSDDTNWALANINVADADTCFVTCNQSADSWKDMALMSFCKHHIIANSSFSWWGAWLSPNEGDTFAPVNWFNPAKVKFNINDFVPNSWNIIQYD